MKKGYVLVLLIVLFVPVLAQASSQGQFDRTLTVSGVVNLDLTTGSGDIVIKTGGANQVLVHGTIHSSGWFSGSDDAVHQVQSNPPIQQSGNSIRIGYNLPDDVKRHVAISYEVTVPADTITQAHSGSGNVSVQGIRASVEATTGSGEIQLRDLGAGVRAHTGSGNIRGQDIAAPFRAQTGSGDVEADLTGSGDVDAQSGSGTIRLRGIKGALRIRTGSGDIGADGAVTGPWQLHTGSGSVRLAVGSSTSFNLNVHTGSGSIHSDLPITVQGSLGKHELQGTVRGGGPEVEVSTGSGDIDIR